MPPAPSSPLKSHPLTRTPSCTEKSNSLSSATATEPSTWVGLLPGFSEKKVTWYFPGASQARYVPSASIGLEEKKSPVREKNISMPSRNGFTDSSVTAPEMTYPFSSVT